LDGDDETFGENVARHRIGIVRDAGLFVDGAADAVAAEFRNDAEAATADFALNGSSDILRAIPEPRGLQAMAKGFFGAARQFVRSGSRRRDFDGDGGVGVVDRKSV